MSRVNRSKAEKIIWITILGAAIIWEFSWIVAVSAMGGGVGIAGFNAFMSIFAIWFTVFCIFEGGTIDKVLSVLFYTAIILSPIFFITNIFGGGWLLLYYLIKKQKEGKQKSRN